MNEIIKKFEKQCWDHQTNHLNSQKFAELIVRECVQVVDSMADPEDSERYFWAIQNASQKIKEHFGLGMSVEDKK